MIEDSDSRAKPQAHPGAAAPDGGSTVTIVHEWDGPPWPLIRRIAAEGVIGPVFVHGIASRTIAGVARAAELARG